jgi:hypothetical protein
MFEAFYPADDFTGQAFRQMAAITGVEQYIIAGQ